MLLSRRLVLQGAMIAGAAGAFPAAFASEEKPVRGGQVVMGIYPEPSSLTSAITTAGTSQYVSGKIFDGLIAHDAAFTPQPQLATEWATSADGLTITFKLRSGVKWHDGTPFTSDDVAFSALEVWKKYHSRGRSTFANVTAIETPDPLTAVFRLSEPAPYLLSALDSIESQIVPRHLYADTDILSNPHNTRPVGTGPFRYRDWQRGEYIVLERNPDYWDQPKPYLDRLILRIVPDPSSATAALETEEIQILPTSSFSDVARLQKIPYIEIGRLSPGALSGLSAFEFNLDREPFKDPRVRQAFAHAIDRDFIRDHIYYGFAQTAYSAIPPDMTAFYTENIEKYPFDLKKAEALLDAAGYKPDANGVRLSITHDPAPTGEVFMRTAEYLRDALGKIGVKVDIRSQDFAGFIRRAYTDRDFDTIGYGAGAGPDPVIGTQRFYWSKNFQKGVAFSNGSHYDNPEVDKLLLAAQVEIDPQKRRDIYAKFQQIVAVDIPKIPLVTLTVLTFSNKRVRQFATTPFGPFDNFASVYVLPS